MQLVTCTLKNGVVLINVVVWEEVDALDKNNLKKNSLLVFEFDHGYNNMV